MDSVIFYQPPSNKQPSHSSAATCSASAASATSIPFIPTVGKNARPAVSQRDKEEIWKDVHVIKTPDECDQAEEENLIVPRDFLSNDSDEDEDFPSLRKLLSSPIREKISVNAKPGPNSTTEVNSRT
jgi:hypothetical protein